MQQGWQLMETKLTQALCSVGLHEVDRNRVMIYGGWANGQDSKQVCTLQKNALNKYHFPTNMNTVMTDPDQFELNGSFYEDDSGNIIVPGKKYTHRIPNTKSEVRMERAHQ